jgi:hypothetical protein
MRSLFLSISLLAVSIPAVAQYSGSAQYSPSSSCPIDFGAQVNGRAIARTIEDEKKNPNASLLELTFGRWDHPQVPKIVSASVTVHGASSSDRYLPVGQRTGLEKVATQTFELGKDRGAAGLLNAEVWVSRMTSVSWAEVRELKYADGSVWHASLDSECKARPSLFRLVDAGAMPR